MALRTWTHSIQHISKRFATKKKPTKIETQSAGVVDLIGSSKTQTVEAFADKYGAIKNVSDAYKIQSGACTILETEYADRYQRKGYKIGGTSADIQSTWNISEPFVSPLYNVWHCRRNETVEKEKVLSIGVESEFIFKIARPLNIENRDSVQLDDIYPLIESVHPGFELVEPRIVADNSESADSIFKVPIQYVIADLCWAGGLVVGPASTMYDLGHASWKQYDQTELQSAAVELYINGDQESIGYGRHVMGSPFNALLFVYRFLLAKGETLKEGEYVSTGTVTGLNILHKGDTAESVFENLGAVELKLI